MRNRGGMNRVKNIPGMIITAFFFAIIVLSLVLFNRRQEKESLTENRMLADFPAEGIADREGLEAWFEDNLGLRDMYLTISGVLNYNLFHRAKTGKVEIGREGFLYLADEGNLELEADKSGDFVSKLPEYAATQQDISDKLKGQGIDYVFMIGPGKPSVYPEYIASSDHKIEETIGDAMYEYLTDNTDVHVFWPKELLTEAKENAEGELVYLKTDTHWTTYGRNIAYRELISMLGEWDIVNTKPAEVKFYPADEPYIGDLSNMMGPVTWAGERLEEESFTDWEVVSPEAELVEQGEKYEAFKKMLIDKNVYNPELCAMFHNDSAPEKNVLICGDSMVGICLLPELAECFSDMTFIWSYSIDQDFIDLIQPDLVISEYGERELRLRLDGIKDF